LPACAKAPTAKALCGLLALKLQRRQAGRRFGEGRARRRGNLTRKDEIASLPIGRQGSTRDDDFLSRDLDGKYFLTEKVIRVILKEGPFRRISIWERRNL